MLKKLMFAAAACAACAGAPAAFAAGGPMALGASASPPMGPGPGTVFFVDPTAMTLRTAAFAKAGTPAGNSFYAAYDAASGTVYVPSPVGTITMMNAATGARIGAFPTIRGARVARVLAQRKLLVVLSARTVAAYALGTHAPVFMLAVGGNAIAVNPSESEIYVGGNMDRTVTAIAVPSGRVTTTYPVARSGDLVFAGGNLFSADIKTGVMSVVDTANGKVTRIKTSEVDPHFAYTAILKATAGFMQAAASPGGHTVYVAGFSGHILKFSAAPAKYLGEIAVRPAKGANKLSGLAIVDGGKEALVTIENRDEAALVSLADGRIVHLFPGVSSNRWVAAPGK